MTSFSRYLGTSLLAGLLWLGCSETKDTSPDAGVGPEVDPWDGQYVPIEELTDWVDPGEYAPCTFTAPLGTAVSCDTPSLFDLSRCDLVSLEGLESQGIYLTTLRTGAGIPLVAGIRVPADGSTGTLNRQALTRQQLDQGFLLSTEYTQPNGSIRQYALAGCGRPEAGRVRGCYARCLNGKVNDVGTFEAARLTWGRGEPESSGGLHLVSESRVELGVPVDVYVTRNHAYVVSITHPDTPAGGLTVFDVSDKRAPVLKKSISLPNDSYWNGVWSKGDALYVASGASGVIVFDITNPADPTYVRALPGGEPIDVHTVHVEGSRLYAMSPAPNADTLVFDVSSPLSPTLLNRIKVEDELGYSRLYVVYYQEGLRVLDVSIPPQPREIAHFNTFRESDPGRDGTETSGAMGVRVPDDGHVYVVDTSRGLLIFNEP